MSVVAVLLVCGLAAVPAVRVRVSSSLGAVFAQKHLLQPFRRQRRSSSRRGGCRLEAGGRRPRRWPKRGRPAIPTARLCWRVLRRLAAITTKALKLLEAGTATNPTGEALELGLLLQRHFGRQTAAAEHLNRVFGSGVKTGDAESLFVLRARRGRSIRFATRRRSTRRPCGAAIPRLKPPLASCFSRPTIRAKR